MPNWATGTLKIRGCTDEILRFCNDILPERAGDRYANEKDRAVSWRMCDENDSYFEDDTLIATAYNDPRLCIYMEDSNRHFIDMDLEVPYFWDLDRKGPYEDGKDTEYRTGFRVYDLPKNTDDAADSLVVFPFMAAWGPDEEYFLELSKKYRLEFKYYVVEQGVGYYAEARFKNGEVVNVVSGPTYVGGNGYGQFVWECPFPFLGG